MRVFHHINLLKQNLGYLFPNTIPVFLRQIDSPRDIRTHLYWGPEEEELQPVSELNAARRRAGVCLRLWSWFMWGMIKNKTGFCGGGERKGRQREGKSGPIWGWLASEEMTGSGNCFPTWRDCISLPPPPFCLHLRFNKDRHQRENNSTSPNHSHTIGW